MAERDQEGGVHLDPAPGGRGTILGVRAQPGARRVGANGVWNGMLKVGVGAPPEDGRANEELLRALAAMLGVRAGDLELLSGARSRTKRIRIELEPGDCAARIERALSGTRADPGGGGTDR